MNRRTSPFGRIVGIAIVAGAVGLGYWAYKSSVSYDTRNDVLNEAAKLPPGKEQSAALRGAYAKTEHDDVKERILLNLGAYKDVEAVPLMIAGARRARHRAPRGRPRARAHRLARRRLGQAQAARGAAQDRRHATRRRSSGRWPCSRSRPPFRTF